MNYTIETVFGTLTVTSNDDLTLTCPSGSDVTKKYDGEALNPAATASGVEGDEITIEYSLDNTTWSEAVPSITNVSEQLVYVRATNSNYDPKTCQYTLKVTPRAVTLTSATDNKEYDGTALTNDAVTVSGDGFVEGEGATYDVTGSQTVVGSSDNEFTYTLNEGTLAVNYTIETVFGTLTVTSNDDLTLTCPSGSDVTKKYDGEALNPAATASGVEGDEITIEYSLDNTTWSEAVPSITNVSEQLVYVRATNSNYDPKTCQYTLKVTPRAVTLTSATDNKEYDGTALTNDAVTVSGDGFVEGEGATYDVTGSQTVVGSSDNEFTYTLNEGTLAVNYTIETVFGTLTVTASDDIELVCPSGSDVTKKYDGEALNPAATASGVEGDEITIEYSLDNTTWSEAVPSITNVSEQLVYVRATNSNYDPKTCQYTLKVTPRAVTLTSATDNKEYDGTALTNDAVTVSGDGFVEGEGATYDVTGSQTVVGSSDNEFTYTLNEGTLAVNYDITTNFGTLTVTPVEAEVVVTIVGNNHTDVYDGEAHMITGYEIVSISNELYTEADFTKPAQDAVVATATRIKNGTTTMTLSADDFANISANFANVTFNVTPGYQTITKRPLIITLTASKHYDGSTLALDYTVFDGVVPDGVTVDVATLETLANGDHLTAGHVETESADQGVYTCTDGSFEYMMANAAVKSGFVIKNANGEGENVNENYTPEFRVTLTINEPVVTIDCGTPLTVIMKDCEENVQLVELIAPELEVAEGVDPSIFTVTPSVPGGLTALTPGTYTVTWTVTDESGTPLATCDQTVTVNYPPCEPVEYQGHTYPVTRIGSQCWLAENLRNTRYDDNVNEGGNIDTYRPVNDDESTVAAYGYLYSWYSAVGVEEDNDEAVPTTFTDECNGEYIQGACPEGWAVPSQADVNQLRTAIGDNASLLKDFDPQYWLPGANGVNPNSGFNAHAGGHYNSAAGRFEGRLLYAYFWESDSQPGASQVISAVISYYCDNVQEIISSKADLRPVRCVRKVTPGM